MYKTTFFTALLMCTFVAQPLFAQVIFGESLNHPGRIVVEAETFSSRTSANGIKWVFVPSETFGVPSVFRNFRGDGYIQALPAQAQIDVGNPFRPPSVEYTVRVTTPGVYHLFVRWDSFDDESDSFFVHIRELNDGPGGNIADWYRYASLPDDRDFASRPWRGSAGFERLDAEGGDTNTLWTISEPGDYIMSFNLREDGAAIDAFVLQLANLTKPTGEGPPPSPKVSGSAALRIHPNSEGGVVSAIAKGSRPSISAKRGN